MYSALLLVLRQSFSIIFITCFRLVNGTCRAVGKAHGKGNAFTFFVDLKHLYFDNLSDFYDGMRIFYKGICEC